MIIYSNGCSHTADIDYSDELVYIDVVAKELFKSKEYNIVHLEKGFYLNDTFHNVSNGKNFDFSKIEDTNYLFKHANSGKSNELIFFESYNVIKDILYNNIKLDYVVIQFSSPNRTIHTEPTGKLLEVTPFDNSEKGLKFEPFASEQTLQYMVLLQDLLKQNNITYCFIPYMELDEAVLDATDKLKYLDESKFTASLKEGHRNYFIDNKLVIDSAGHPNTIGYNRLAKMILKILRKTVLI